MSAPLQLGLIGLGYWGPNLLRVLLELEDVDVRWICDLDADRLGPFARRHPTVQTTVDADEILFDDAVDAVVVATPVFTHFDLATRSLTAGKHTFVEKPLAPSIGEADQLIELARAQNRVIACGHTFLYSPPVREVKRLLDSDELGDVFFVSSSRVNLGLHQRDVSVIWDLGPHDFSILLYWLQQVPRSVRAVGRDSIVPGTPDVAFVTLIYDSGVVANVELSWLAPSKLRRTVVVGSRKMIVYDDGTREPLRVFDHGVDYDDPGTFGEYQLSYRTGDILSPRLDTYEPLALELADFAEAVASNTSMIEHLDIARNVVRLTEAADWSLRNGGAEVSLNGSHGFDTLATAGPVPALTPRS